jgi:hypothetical protein
MPSVSRPVACAPAPGMHVADASSPHRILARSWFSGTDGEASRRFVAQTGGCSKVHAYPSYKPHFLEDSGSTSSKWLNAPGLLAGFWKLLNSGLEPSVRCDAIGQRWRLALHTPHVRTGCSRTDDAGISLVE